MVEVKDCSAKIWDLRVIKSPAEVNLLRKAGGIAVKAHIEMIKATRPGMYEYELAALYEYYCKKEGAQDLAYYAIICSGPNHPYLHYYKHDRLLEDGDFLVIANEPLAVWAEEELGVRVEDTILITEDGCENLTAGIPRTVKDIETLMKKDGVVQILKKNKLY